MEKIPTLFKRVGRTVVDEVTPGCEWVLRGEGVPKEKLDGTNVRVTVRNGTAVRLEKRRNPSKSQKADGILEPWYVDAVEGPEDKWIVNALEETDVSGWPDGEHCCEAVGPKIQNNSLGLEVRVCVPFDLDPLPIEGEHPRTFQSIQNALGELESRFSPGHQAEGIVFHHADGRRAKIKRKDF